MVDISEWLAHEVMPSLWVFVVPLLPWTFISMVAPLVRYRLDLQLWKYNKKQHATHKKPRFSKYRNAAINCLLIVLLAGLCKITFAEAIGVTIVSNVIMIVFAAVQVVKCINTYLKIENVGFRINIFKIFNKSALKDVLEQEKETEHSNDDEELQK